MTSLLGRWRRRRVGRLLLLRAEGELDPAGAAELGRELGRSERWRELEAEVHRRLEAARLLGRVEMPSWRAEQVRRALARQPAASGEAKARPPRRTRRARWAGLAGVAAALLLVALVLERQGPDLAVERSVGEPTAFERLAGDVHRRLASGELGLDLRSDSPLEVRRWVQQTAGVTLTLPSRRPEEERGRFVVLGAAVIEAPSLRAAAVSYLIDGRPTTLLSAPEAQVPGAPRWGPFGKTIRYRFDPASGAKLLSWTNSGNAYTLVSQLPRLGQEACHICHTDPERREIIDGLDG